MNVLWYFYGCILNLFSYFALISSTNNILLSIWTEEKFTLFPDVYYVLVLALSVFVKYGLNWKIKIKRLSQHMERRDCDPWIPSLKYLKLDYYCFYISHSFVWLFAAAPNPCAKELFPLSLKEIYEMFSSNNHFSLQCTARDKGFYFSQAKRTSERAAGQ